MKTEYKNVSELVNMFESYWVPYKLGTINTVENGIDIEYVIDQKSERLYIEQYNSTTDTKCVSVFDKGQYPSHWYCEEDCPNAVDVTF